jgi:L-threonylcarbamoyladenylate synthase
MTILSWKFHKIDYLLSKKMGQERAILCSTDTVLGLIAPVSQKGKEILDTIKKRDLKPYLIIIGSLDQLDYFIEPEVKINLLSLFKTLWPGPVTLILPAKSDLPSYCVSQKSTVALRFPAHAGLQKVALHYEGIFSTSANISNMPIPHSFEEIDLLILQQVATIVMDKDLSLVPSIPSTIIDCTKKPYTIVREGAYKKEKLIKLLSNY